jgi:pimeloyl-ACP methyl ester carboxylesterase
MQSHGAFLDEHPGRSVQRVADELTEKPVLLGIGFGSLVALSVAARTDVAGLILYDPWWDIDLLDDPEEYLRTAFKHHHYLYRDERSGLPESLRDFDDLYPYSYVDDVDTSILVFISEDPSVPREATAEMQDLLDLTVVDHTAVSVNQCFIQHMDRVYSYLNEATL